MRDAILSLDDATALRIASQFARAHLGNRDLAKDLDPGLAESIRCSFLHDPPSGTTTLDSHPKLSDGDVARTALLLLAEHRDHQQAIRALVAGPAAQKFMGVEILAAGVIGLVVLQTHVKFERGKDGRWTLRIEKKPTSDGLLEKLARGVIARFGAK